MKHQRLPMVYINFLRSTYSHSWRVNKTVFSALLCANERTRVGSEARWERRARSRYRRKWNLIKFHPRARYTRTSPAYGAAAGYGMEEAAAAAAAAGSVGGHHGDAPPAASAPPWRHRSIDPASSLLLLLLLQPGKIELTGVLSGSAGEIKKVHKRKMGN